MTGMISICVPTYRRASLERTLESLAQQIIPSGFEAEIIVVDNDSSGSAWPIVERLAARSPYPIRYHVEARRGLAFARNRALALARGDWLALIDDDEIAEPRWLTELTGCGRRLNADAVVGAVHAQFESEPAPWVIASQFFEFSLPPTGTKLDMADALSGNALLRASFLRRHGLAFDADFNKTGGEDTDFFRRICDHGGLVVSCREAVTRELIPPERLTPRYIEQRSLATGEIYARVTRCHSGPWRFWISMARASVNVVAAAGLAAVLLCFRRESYYRYYLLLVRNIGKLRYAFGCLPTEMYGGDDLPGRAGGA